jgi:hypothetical protein
MLDLSSDSSDSYNGNDAHRFLREWRAAQDRISKVTRENGQLKARLRVIEVALHATEEEARATRARLAEADAMVAGNFYYSKKTHVPILENHLLDNLLISLFASLDGAVGKPPSGGERSYGGYQC